MNNSKKVTGINLLVKFNKMSDSNKLQFMEMIAQITNAGLDLDSKKEQEPKSNFIVKESIFHGEDEPLPKKLVNADTLEPVNIGDEVTTFRGEKAIVKSITPPHKISSSGKVNNYYASVYNLKFI